MTLIILGILVSPRGAPPVVLVASAKTVVEAAITAKTTIVPEKPPRSMI